MGCNRVCVLWRSAVTVVLALCLCIVLFLSLQVGGNIVAAKSLLEPLRSADAPGLISGDVVDSSGQPLVGIRVGLYRLYDEAPFRATLTAADGSYQFSVLSPGIYKVEFIDLSYQHGFQFYPGKSSLLEAEAISIAGSQRTNVDAQLVLPATIVGSVNALPNSASVYGQVNLYRPGNGDHCMTINR